MTRPSRTYKTRSGWWVWTARALLGLVGLAALAILILWLALGSASFRQNLLARASQWTEAEYGITFSARDVSLQLRPLHGSLHFQGVAIASVTGGRFLAAESLGLLANPWSLVRAPRHIEHIEVSGVVFDLDRVPSAWLMGSGEKQVREPLELPDVERVAVYGLNVRSLGSLIEADWLEKLEVAGAGIEAKVEDQRLDLSVVAGQLEVDTSYTEPLVVDIEGGVSRDPDGSLIVRASALLGGFENRSGEFALGLDIRGTGLEDLYGDYTLEFDPSTVLLGAASGRTVKASGDFDLARRDLSLALAAPGQSLALLERFMDPQAWSRYGIDPVRLDLEADLEMKNGASAGEVRLTVSDSGDEILNLEAQPRFSIGENVLEAQFEAMVYPDRTGTRRLSGTVKADVRVLDQAVLEGGEATLRISDLGAELRFLREKFSALFSAELFSAEMYEAIRGPARGSLNGTSDVSGRLLDPELTADLDWKPTAGSRVDVSYSGQPLRASGDVHATFEGLPVELFADASGIINGRASVSLPGSAGSNPTILLELATPSLEVGGERMVENASLTARSLGELLSWQAQGSSPGYGPFEASGSLPARLPVETAEARLKLVSGPPALSRIDLEARLEQGMLELATVEPAIMFDSTVTLEAAMPSRTLAGAVPALAGWIAEGPLLPSDDAGPMTVTLDIEPGDWAEAVEDLTGLPIEKATAGAHLEIALDPVRPSLAVGRLALDDLQATTETGAWSAEPLVVQIGGGGARIEPWVIASDSERVEVSGEVAFASGWTSDQPLWDLINGGAGLLVARFSEAAEGSGAGLAPAWLESLKLPWRLERDRLEVVDGRIGFATSAAGDPAQGRVAAAISLLDKGDSGSMGGIGDGGGAGAFEIDLAVPVRDWRAALAREGLAGGLDSLEASLEVELVGETNDLLAARGRLVVPVLRVRLGERTSELEQPLVVTIGDRRAVLEDGALKTAGEVFRYGGSVDLADAWSANEGLEAAIKGLEFAARGRIDSAVLNPLLSGGVASGALDVDVSLSGALDELQGRAQLTGDGASIIYREPYLTQVSKPDIDVTFSDGRVEVQRGVVSLNEGEVELSGALLDGEGATDLDLAVRAANFRLDHGLIVKVDSDLRIRSPLPPEAVAGLAEASDRDVLISGRIDVDRGYLNRRINLDVDFLTQLLAPIDLTSTRDDPLEAIELDLKVTTKEGVRVKNNIADLLATWDPISVRGSLLRPVLEGRIELESGGLVHLYGQTVRLDKASLFYPGSLGESPRLELETTTSLQDPSIGRLAGNDPFRGEDETEQPIVGLNDVTGDLARYYGEQLAQRLSESLGEFEVSIRPLLVFGEADPSTRLTVSRDFSANVALAASVDLRNAESRTYVLDVHELQSLPGLVGQTFTDDESAYGGSLFQKLRFGGTAHLDQDGPRIRRIRVPKLPGVSKRGIKRNLGIAKGDRLASGSAFTAELSLIEYLRQRGYPSALARVIASPASPESSTSTDNDADRVELEVEVEPGPLVAFAFSGEKIPKPLRGSIRDLYSVEAPDSETLENIRAQTVRVLRSRGFLDPEVEVEIVRGSEAGLTIEVRSVGGVRIESVAPVFVGLGTEDAEVVGRQFAGPVQRAELAMGLPEADDRVLRTLVKLGYPRARIVRRWSEKDAKALNVEVDAGPRRRIHAIELTGAGSEGERTRLSEELVVQVDGPARGDLLALSVLQIEDRLREDGYGRARVSLQIEDLPEDPLATIVTFGVEKGSRETVNAVDFDGLRASRKSWARRAAGLESGTSLGPSALNLARGNLLGTGVFSSVSSRLELQGAPGTRVVFEVEEHERYEVAYGARWRSEDGLSAVLDASNRNLFGRGATIAFRALYRDDDKSLRGLLRFPRAKVDAGSFELFATTRRRVDAGIIEDTLETTLQYSRPFAEHGTVRLYGRYRDTELVEEVPDPFFPLDERIKRPLFGTQYIFDNRSRDPIHPRGTLFSVDLSGSDESFGDFGFARVFSQLLHFRGLGSATGARLTWGQSLQLGAASAFGDLFLLPADRFSAGGEYSVRGYGLESLGPENPRLFARESAVVVLNQELRWEALDWLSPVVFADVGNVYQDLGEIGSDLFAAVGLGVRALTPVGLLRLDVAHALNRRASDPEFKLYFGLGTSF